MAIKSILFCPKCQDSAVDRHLDRAKVPACAAFSEWRLPRQPSRPNG